MWIKYLDSNGTLTYAGDAMPELESGESKQNIPSYKYYGIQPLYLFKYDGSDVVGNDEENIMTYMGRGYKIYDLVNDELFEKNIHDINYQTELKSGIKLHTIQTFTNDGLLDKTEFYNNYVDMNNKGDLILVVDESYIMIDNEDHLNLSARKVVERIKTRKWVKYDGSIDDVNVKITNKKYDTFAKRNSEGRRRRNNIVNYIYINIITAGVYSGIFTDVENGESELIDLMSDNNNDYNSYIASGKGHLIDAINTHSNAWLDSIVADNPYTQSLCSWMIGMTLRSYMIEKLKGNIQ